MDIGDYKLPPVHLDYSNMLFTDVMKHILKILLIFHKSKLINLKALNNMNGNVCHFEKKSLRRKKLWPNFTFMI